MNPSDRSGLIYILTSVTGFALIPIWVKSMQAAGMGSLDILVWRYLLAMALFWGLIRLRRMPVTGNLPRKGLFGMGALLGIGALMGVYGLERLPAGTLVVLFYTYPAMVAVLAALMGERLTGRGWAALALTTVGVVLTVPDFGAGLGSESMTGVLLTLGNAFIVAIYFIVNGRLLRGQRDFARASAWGITGSFAMLAVLALVLRNVQPPPNADISLRLLLLASISTVMPIFFLNMGIQRIGPARAAISGTVEPILTLIFAALFLGEGMQLVQLIGGGLILASVVLLQIPSRRKSTPV
jgi:drug/metabolite transporter (DMT)-like permease